MSDPHSSKFSTPKRWARNSVLMDGKYHLCHHIVKNMQRPICILKPNIYAYRIRFNNKRGSVVGQVEGEKDKIDQMALWLKLQGV